MDLTLFQKPQLNLARSTPGRMQFVSICALFAVFQSSLSDNWHSLYIALAAVAGAVGTELLFNFRERYFSIKDGSAVCSALILCLFLPNMINPLFAFLGSIFAMVIIKHSFGGLGTNWVNPAAGAWLFIRASWPHAFNRSLEAGHLTQLAASLEGGLRDSQASPLALLMINGWSSSPLDISISSFLNNTIFTYTGTALPQGYLALLSPSGPGIIADRGLLFFLLGIVFISATKCFRFWLPAGFLFIYLLLVRIFGALSFGGGFWEGDIIFTLLSGGTLAAAFILVSDPATGPKTTSGYAVYIILAALFTFLFRYPGLDPYGVVTAILLANTLVPLIQKIENIYYFEKRKRT